MLFQTLCNYNFFYIFIIECNKKYYFNIKLYHIIDNIMFIFKFYLFKKIFNKYLDTYKCEYKYFHYCIGMKMRHKYILSLSKLQAN